jgi:hypothetical protein
MIVKDSLAWYAPCTGSLGAEVWRARVAARIPGSPAPEGDAGGESTDGASQQLVIPIDGGGRRVGDSIRLHRPRGYYGPFGLDAGRSESLGGLPDCPSGQYRADGYATASASHPPGSRGRGRRAQRGHEARCLPARESGGRTQEIVRADIELNPMERGLRPPGKRQGNDLANKQSPTTPFTISCASSALFMPDCLPCRAFFSL